jgi:hypothetical protein
MIRQRRRCRRSSCGNGDENSQGEGGKPGQNQDFSFALPEVLHDNRIYAETNSPPSGSRLAAHRRILACLPGTDHGPAQQKPKSVGQFAKKLVS